MTDRRDAAAMFIRLVIPKKHPDTGMEMGIFQAANELHRVAGVSEVDLRKLDELITWFGDNLKTPARFNRTKSKGYYRRATKGVSWIKTTAEAHMARL